MRRLSVESSTQIQFKKNIAFQQSQEKTHFFLLAWLGYITVLEKIHRGQENVIFYLARLSHMNSIF